MKICKCIPDKVRAADKDDEHPEIRHLELNQVQPTLSDMGDKSGRGAEFQDKTDHTQEDGPATVPAMEDKTSDDKSKEREGKPNDKEFITVNSLKI